MYKPYITSSDFWLREATKFPIEDIGLAKNYLDMAYGNVIIGKTSIDKLISKETFDTMLGLGYFEQRHSNGFLYKPYGGFA